MPETWVHGNAFAPRLYGPDHLANIDGIAWTDQQGLREGDRIKFNMRDNRVNWFHATIPVSARQELRSVQVEYHSIIPLLAVFVHSGLALVASTGNPTFQSSGTFSTMTITVSRAVSRGICVSLGFSTTDDGVGAGLVTFYGAGANFA